MIFSLFLTLFNVVRNFYDKLSPLMTADYISHLTSHFCFKHLSIDLYIALLKLEAFVLYYCNGSCCHNIHVNLCVQIMQMHKSYDLVL